VRCLEDPALVAELRARQIPLEVCPTSNIRLNIFPSLAAHALPCMLGEGLYITINSDDPPMFNTTLTDEWLAASQTFDFDMATIERLVLNVIHASLLSHIEKQRMQREFMAEFDKLELESKCAASSSA
jgi:adenosine deaminase